MGADSTWSDAELSLMRRLWNDEGKSAEEIAGAIGRQFRVYRTRSSVLGKIHRMPSLFRARGRRQAAIEGHQRRRAQAPVAPTPMKTLAVRPQRALRTVAEMIEGRNARLSRREDAAPVLAKALIDLANRECRFPVAGDQPADILFCAAAIEPEAWMPGKVGGCYCAAHRALTGAGFSAPGTFVDRGRRAL